MSQICKKIIVLTSVLMTFCYVHDSRGQATVSNDTNNIPVVKTDVQQSDFYTDKYAKYTYVTRKTNAEFKAQPFADIIQTSEHIVDLPKDIYADLNNPTSTTRPNRTDVMNLINAILAGFPFRNISFENEPMNQRKERMIDALKALLYATATNPVYEAAMFSTTQKSNVPPIDICNALILFLIRSHGSYTAERVLETIPPRIQGLFTDEYTQRIDQLQQALAEEAAKALH